MSPLEKVSKKEKGSTAKKGKGKGKKSKKKVTNTI